MSRPAAQSLPACCGNNRGAAVGRGNLPRFDDSPAAGRGQQTEWEAEGQGAGERYGDKGGSDPTGGGGGGGGSGSTGAWGPLVGLPKVIVKKEPPAQQPKHTDDQPKGGNAKDDKPEGGGSVTKQPKQPPTPKFGPCCPPIRWTYVSDTHWSLDYQSSALAAFELSGLAQVPASFPVAATPALKAQAAMDALVGPLYQLAVLECLWNRLWQRAVSSPNTIHSILSSTLKQAGSWPAISVNPNGGLFSSTAALAKLFDSLQVPCQGVDLVPAHLLGGSVVGKCLAVALSKQLSVAQCPSTIGSFGANIAFKGSLAGKPTSPATATPQDKLAICVARAVAVATETSVLKFAVDPNDKWSKILPRWAWFLTERGGPVGCAPFVVRVWRALRVSFANLGVTSPSAVAATPLPQLWAKAAKGWPGYNGYTWAYGAAYEVPAAQAAVAVVALSRRLSTAKSLLDWTLIDQPPSLSEVVEEVASSVTKSAGVAPPAKASAELLQVAEQVAGADTAVAAMDHLASFAFERFRDARVAMALLIASGGLTPATAALALPLLRSWSLITSVNPGEVCLAASAGPTVWAWGVLGSPKLSMSKFG